MSNQGQDLENKNKEPMEKGKKTTNQVRGSRTMNEKPTTKKQVTGRRNKVPGPRTRFKEPETRNKEPGTGDKGNTGWMDEWMKRLISDSELFY